MRSSVSSQHTGPPNYLFSARHNDQLLLNEWRLVLRGDGKSPKTVDGYLDSVRRLAAFLAEGNFPDLGNASAEHIREWLNALRDRGNKPATVNTRYRGAHAFYAWLKREGEIRDSPLEPIKPPRVPETVQPYYTEDHVAALLKSLRSRRAKGLDAARTRAIILLLFDTGVRATELCELRAEDVDCYAVSRRRAMPDVAVLSII